jgi:hypothetical protein
MKHVVAVLAAAMLLTVAASCSGEEVLEGGRTEGAETLVEEALAAMDGLNSYRLEMGFAPGEAPPIVIEFVAPDSYRSQWTAVRATNGSESPEGVFDIILVGDKAYARQCEALRQDCEDWQEGPRPAVPIAGPSPSFLPQWPLVAMEMAQGVQDLGGERIDGNSLVHLRGSVNHIRAVMENERRIFAATGITSFGEECKLEAAAPVSGTPIEREQVCRELTYEEALENQEPALSFYDQNPATIDVWLSPDDFLVHRIELTIPPHDDPSVEVEPPDEETSVLFEYAAFNEIVIEPPR